MSSTLVSPYFDSANDVFCRFNDRTPDAFSPTNSFSMNYDKQLFGSSIGFDEMKRQSSGSSFPLMRSMSCSVSTKSILPIGTDSVFNSNNFDNSKETRPRDRAFSESDRNQRNNQNSNRYKTELCRPFEENGKCKYGDKCQFAHGIHEIRNLQRHPKYKTELCRTYHTVGICPYGPRCHFIHSPSERKNYSNTSPKQRRDRTVERPKLLPFSSVPLGSTGDLTPPPSVCDSPSPFSPYGGHDGMEDNFLEALTAQARELATGDHTELLMSPRGMSPTLPSPIQSAPGSPFPPGHGFGVDMQLKDNVFFSSGVDSKPPSPIAYRPPSPPDSPDPETFCDRSSSPTGSAGNTRSSRLPIFRVMSMEEYR